MVRRPSAEPEVRAQLEEELDGRVDDLNPCSQEWGQSGALHFTGVWRRLRRRCW